MPFDARRASRCQDPLHCDTGQSLRGSILAVDMLQPSQPPFTSPPSPRRLTQMLDLPVADAKRARCRCIPPQPAMICEVDARRRRRIHDGAAGVLPEPPGHLKERRA